MVSARFVPLRVRAVLGCGVVTDQWLPLDGPLLAAHLARHLPPRLVTVSGAGLPADYGVHVPRLPVARRWADGEWYYACSFAQWSGDVTEETDHWNKRFDLAMIGTLRDRRSVDLGSGPYRSYHMPVFARVAQWVEWHLLADPDALASLLDRLTHLGKKTAQGWGRVVAWEVERAAYNRSVIGPEHQLMRAIPEAEAQLLGVAYARGSYTLRPPHASGAAQTVALPVTV